MSRRGVFNGVVLAIAIGFFAIGGAVVASSRDAAARASDLSAVPNLSCSSASPCATDTNALTGPGLSSTSTGGTGLTASTAFASTSATKFAAGLLGTDASTKGRFDAGVEGKSTRGIGVFGTSPKGIGIQGISNSTSIGTQAILGQATGGGIGVEGKSLTGSFSIGVLGQSNSVGVEGFGSQSTSTGILAGGSG